MRTYRLLAGLLCSAAFLSWLPIAAAQDPSEFDYLRSHVISPGDADLAPATARLPPRPPPRCVCLRMCRLSRQTAGAHRRNATPCCGEEGRR
jgi:hypothetical protein